MHHVYIYSRACRRTPQSTPRRLHSLWRLRFATLLVPGRELSRTELLVAANQNRNCINLLTRHDTHQHNIMHAHNYIRHKHLSSFCTEITSTYDFYFCETPDILKTPSPPSHSRALHFRTRDRTSTTFAPRATLTRQSWDVTMLRRSNSWSLTFVHARRLMHGEHERQKYAG